MIALDKLQTEVAEIAKEERRGSLRDRFAVLLTDTRGDIARANITRRATRAEALAQVGVVDLMYRRRFRRVS